MLVRSICAVVSLALFLGCSSPTIKIDHDPAANFTGMKTYQWLPPVKTGKARLDGNKLLEMRVKSAVDLELAKKGYRKITDGTPDFVVGYHVTLDQKQSGEVINTSYDYDAQWGGYDSVPVPQAVPNQTYVYEYQEGTLILSISQPGTKKLLWRGSVTDRVNFEGSPENKEDAINAAVRDLLAQFPPK